MAGQSTDLRAELASIRAAFASLVESATNATFAWTGKAATRQYQANKRGRAALERLGEIEPELLGAKPEPLVPAEVLAAVRKALDETEWSGVGGGLGGAEPVDDLIAQTRKLLRLLGVNA